MTDENQTALQLRETIENIDILLATHETEGASLEAVGDYWGHYKGLPPEIALLPDGRGAELRAPISYHGLDGVDWPVPVGSKLDGASIPRAFWTLIGGPFEGKYRDASIVHDRYCVTQERTWRDTHRMFHDAMRCSGVGRARAGVMFYAVYRFGPRWPAPGLEAAAEIAVPAPGVGDSATLMRDAEAIVTRDLGPPAIAALADSRDAQK